MINCCKKRQLIPTKDLGVHMPLPNGSVTLVSKVDYPIISRYRWKRMSHGYVCSYLNESRAGGMKRKIHTLHRFIMMPPRNMEVDHINGDKLDNRRENLRICTRAENSRNSVISSRNKSGYKGVYRASQGTPWIAQVRVGTTTKYLGRFKDRLSAARAYNEAAQEHYGEFARLNPL